MEALEDMAAGMAVMTSLVVVMEVDMTNMVEEIHIKVDMATIMEAMKAATMVADMTRVEAMVSSR